MNSSKKIRKRISTRCRKLSSTSNRCQQSFSHVTPAGSYKRRINSLLKNNKNLAVALEDAQCELSSKRKLFQESAEYLNKIQFARFKMLEMYSVLKCFMKDFDETLLILKFDDSKWLEFGAPTRPCRNLKSKMSKVVESADEISEKVFINHTSENDKCSSNQLSLSVCSSPNACNKEISERADDVLRNTSDEEIVNYSVKDHIENAEAEEMKDTNSLSIGFHGSPVELCEDTGVGARSEMVEIETSPQNVSPLIDEDCRTPKLSISLLTTRDLEVTSESNPNSALQNCQLSVGNLSKVENHPADVTSSVKSHVSKIPRIQDLPIKINEPKVISRSENLTYKRKFKKGTEEFDSNFCRRKTFVIKDNETVPNSESSVPLNSNLSPFAENLNEIVSKVDEELDVVNRRKTYVVNVLMIPVDAPNSDRNKRKTFIKESNHSTLVAHRRDTFTISDHTIKISEGNETIDHGETPSMVIDNNDMVKKSSLPNNDMETNVHSPVNENSILTVNSKEAEQILNNPEISSHKNIISNVHPEELHQTNELLETQLNAVNMTNNSEEQRKIDYDVESEQNEVEFLKEDIKILDECIPVNDHVAKAAEVIDLSSVISSTRPHKRMSYKQFLESSESECELIPNEDLSFVKQVSSIKTPIRRRISSFKSKKVFVFDGNERRSTANKKTIKKRTGLKEVSKISKGTEVCLFDDNNINIEEQTTVLNKKTVSFILNEQIDENNPVDNAHSDLNNVIEKISKTSTDEVNSKETCKKKNILSDVNVLNSINNTDLNTIGGTSEICLKPVTKKKNYNIKEKRHVNYVDKKQHVVDNLVSEPMKVGCSNNTSKCYKVKHAKQASSKENIDIDNIITVAKKSTKSSKKRSNPNICVEDEAIFSNITENTINNVIESNSLGLKTMKTVNKGKNKVKNDVSCKKTGKNTFLVHAEIHPPPPSLNTSDIQSVNKENEEMLGLENYQVSVVLNDIFKSENINTLNISCENDLILPGKSFSQKTPFSDNSCNILAAPVEGTLSVHENIACVAKSKEITRGKRRRRDVQSYKEPSLMRKLRR